MAKQGTLANPVDYSGITVHAGTEARMRLLPAEPDTGIVFKRIDITDADNLVQARYDSVTDTMNGTSISNEAGTKIATVEHLMAALASQGIDNALVELDGEEIPIADGCSEIYVGLIREAGRQEQDRPRKRLKVLSPVEVVDLPKKVALLPDDDGFSVDLEIDFENPVIGRQRYALEVSADTFADEIAGARTFGFYKDLELFQSLGLAKGASLDNTIAIDGESIMNEGGLKYEDEFVRHKVLDVIGDLSLAGAPIIGRFEGLRSGHAINNQLLRALFAQPDAYTIVED